MKEMQKKIKAVFEALKQLDIKATPGNVSIMHGVFNYLKEIYAEMEADGDGRPEDHPERRDDA